MRKSHKILFTLSVVLNLVLLGVVGGHMAKRYHDTPWNEMKETLAPQTRDLLKASFEGKREKIHALMREMREKKKNMEAIFSAPEFDVAAFDAAVADWQEFNKNTTQGKMESFKAIMAQLPQEERAKLAPRFVNVLTGSMDRKDKGKHAKPHHDHKDTPPPPPLSPPAATTPAAPE